MFLKYNNNNVLIWIITFIFLKRQCTQQKALLNEGESTSYKSLSGSIEIYFRCLPAFSLLIYFQCYCCRQHDKFVKNCEMIKINERATNKVYYQRTCYTYYYSLSEFKVNSTLKKGGKD